MVLERLDTFLCSISDPPGDVGADGTAEAAVGVEGAEFLVDAASDLLGLFTMLLLLLLLVF